MLEFRLFLAQRITALIMAPLVVTHIIVMIYAIQGGLTVAEILSRTQGSFAWAIFYGLFVVAVSIHAAIGLRTIAAELLQMKGVVLDIAAVLVGVGLLAMGGQAVWSVTAVPSP